MGKGERAANYKVYGHSAVSCAKTAEPIEMAFRLSIRVIPRNLVLDGVQIPHAILRGKGAARCKI